MISERAEGMHPEHDPGNPGPGRDSVSGPSRSMERIGAAVIGGGAVGCAILYELAKAGFRDLFLFEKLPRLGEVQSGRNSGVVHAGIYYRTGSAKAALCVEGNPLMYEFCRVNGVPVENTGKLVVASSEDEIGKLEQVHAQAAANGVPGVEMLTSAQIRRLEPCVEAPAALFCPTTGIVDAAGLVKALARLARDRGASILTGREVTAISPLAGGSFEVTCRCNGVDETFEAEIVVNSAGLYSDEIARMVNPSFGARIAPLRGEYYKFNRLRRKEIMLNRMNVYPVPGTVDVGGRKVGVVGVHLTPTFGYSEGRPCALGDVVTVGPEFVSVEDRNDFESGRLGPDLFHARAKRFFPGLRLSDLEIDFAGIMANLESGTDFIIERDARHPCCIHLVGIDSPGLTSSLAIARKVADMLR